jgi:cytochrome c oxidase assembly protein subunit 15
LRGAYPPSIRDPAIAIAGLVVLQYILGVTALVSHMIDTGVAHQMNAVLLLAAIVWLLHGLRGGGLRRPA